MAKASLILRHSPGAIEVKALNYHVLFLGPGAEEELRVWLNDRKDHPVSVPLELSLIGRSNE